MFKGAPVREPRDDLLPQFAGLCNVAACSLPVFDLFDPNDAIQAMLRMIEIVRVLDAFQLPDAGPLRNFHFRFAKWALS